MLVNIEKISALYPCAARFNNYLTHYEHFRGTLEEFFALDKITHSDKLWVALRLLPRFEVEVFAIDCAAVAQGYDTANAAANAAAANAAAVAADYTTTATTADAIIEQARQLEALLYLSERIGE